MTPPRPHLVAVYVDVRCAWSARVWRWLSLLPERQQVDVRPFWTAPDGTPASPWDRTVADWSLELLALGEMAREVGPITHRALVDAAFRRVHDPATDHTHPESWLALAAEVGLDLGAFAADGERWRAEVGLWQREAVDDLSVRAVPTLLLDSGATLLLRLRRPVADPAGARRLHRQLREVARQPVA